MSEDAHETPATPTPSQSDGSLIPPRPTAHDAFVRTAAAEALLPELIAWTKQCGEPEPDEEDRAAMVKDLAEELSVGFDGFELVKRLERSMYFQGDSALVEILDGAWHKLSAAHSKACEDWVKAYQPLAPKIETLVRWPKCNKPNSGVGVVTALQADGRATVMFIDLGHGVMTNGCGTMGSIVAWEELVDEPDQPARIRYVKPAPQPPPEKPLVLQSEEGAVEDRFPAGFTPREKEMLTALRMIAHATARTPGVPDDDSGYHESAWELSTDAISKVTGEARGW